MSNYSPAKNNIRQIACLLLIVFNIQLSYAQIKDSIPNRFIFKSLYNYAIQEDVKTMLSVLDTLPESRLTPDDQLLKKKLYTRFTTTKEKYDYGTTDPMLMGVIDIYRNYWTSILLKQKSIEPADSLLMQQLSEFLLKKYAVTNKWNEAEVKASPMKYFSQLLTKSNYFNNVDGKTGNLYDIYIWKTQDTVDYKVELTDGVITVPVLFMKDIITLGWEEYATFGAAYPGGWPFDNMLYCVAKAYDTKNETFSVSYLAHEAQHFSDIKTYTEIPSWHLEYRAKLAELSKASETMSKLLTGFTRGAKNDSTLTHPFAEYCVMHSLSQQFFREEWTMDFTKWNAIAVADINKKAGLLLAEDSKKLTRKN